MANKNATLNYAYGKTEGITCEVLDATSSDTVVIPIKREQCMGVILTNKGTSKVTATIKAGNRYAAALGDVSIEVNGSSQVLVPLNDTARYMQEDGNIHLTTTGALTVNAFVI